jgi:3-phenylpropionate/trans-cinnamate dioxygenase ferredoxin subunit
MTRHVLAHMADIADGGAKRFEVAGRPIALFRQGEEFFALLDKCPHQGAPLCAGRRVGVAEAARPGDYQLTRKGEMLRCPWHGWEFDVRTGQSFCEPSKVSIRTYPMEVAEGQTVVKGPYVAETVPVTIEEQYVVIDF